MEIRFVKCKNPNYQHIKMVYGELLKTWNKLVCECGNEFEGFIEICNDVCPDKFSAFEDVDDKAETKVFPPINEKQSDPKA